MNVKHIIHMQLLFIALIFVAAPAHAQYYNEVPLKIVVFGDSITANSELAPEVSFPTRLEQKLLSDGYVTEVINMSRAGETTITALERIRDVVELNPDIVIVQLGYNDAIRGISPEKVIYSNIYQIVSTLKRVGATSILLDAELPEGVSKAYRKRYKHMRSSLLRAGITKYQYPDILKDLHNRPDLTLADGVHPNEKGVLTMVHNVSPYIAPIVKWRIELQNFKKENM